MCCACLLKEFPKWPLGGHQQEREGQADQGPLGAEQWNRSWQKWVSHGTGHKWLQKIKMDGGIVLMPYAPKWGKKE